MNSEASRTELRSGERSREMLSFLVVGSVGFVVDAAILTLLTAYAGWSPWLARIPSFLGAVFVTWALNRKHTFAERGLQRRHTEAFYYLVIQSGGALINLTIFWICLAAQPQLAKLPVIPLAVGSAGAMIFNYLISSKWLYGQWRSTAARQR